MLGRLGLPRHLHIPVVVQDGIRQGLQLHGLAEPSLVDGPLVPQPGGHAQQPHAHGIRVSFVQAYGGVVSDHHRAEVRLPLVPQKSGQLGDVPVQPLVAVDGEMPGSGAAVHHRVAGGGKIVDPREVEQNIRVPRRDLPAAVGGAGVRHHQLAGNGLPQRRQGLQAPLDTADLILEDDADGQDGLFPCAHEYLSSLVPRLGKGAAPVPFPKRGTGAGRSPPPLVGLCGF